MLAFTILLLSAIVGLVVFGLPGAVIGVLGGLLLWWALKLAVGIGDLAGSAMTTKKCPDCRKKISRFAKVCPYCSHQFKEEQ